MVIRNIHVQNFGKLQNFELNLSEGLNEICAENGFGKTTLSDFILVMFYGFEGETKRKNLLENQRKRYLPWQGGCYGGSITFEQNGKLYRLERTFGKAVKEDTFRLYDAVTMLKTTDFSANIGEELFHIDRDSFAKTAFMGQKNIQTEATAGIQAKIGNLASEMADLGNYETVEAKIKDCLNKMSPSRKTGDIFKLKSEIAVLKNGVLNENSEEKRIELLKVQREAYWREKDCCIAEQSAIEKQIAEISVQKERLNEGLFEKQKYEFLYQQYLEGIETYKKKRAYFPKAVPELETVNRMISFNQEYRSYVKAFQDNRLTPEEKELVKSFADDIRVTDQVSDCNNIGKKSLQSMLCFIAAVIFISFGIVSFILNWSIWSIIFAVIAGILCIGVGRVLKTKQEAAKKEVLRQEEAAVKAKMELLLKQEQVKKKEKQLSEIQEQITAHEKELFAFLLEYGFCGREERIDENIYFLKIFEEIRDVILALDNSKNYLWNQKQVLEDYQTSEYQEKWNELEQLEQELQKKSIQELTQRQECLRREMESLNQKLHTLDMQIEDGEERLDRMNEEKEKLAVLSQDYVKQMHQYDILSKTFELLREAKESLSTKYMLPFEKSFKEYYALLDDKKDYVIDANLNVSVREQGKMREVGFLSTGYQDLVHLCSRMAMLDSMYSEEKPVLIMDDPFANLDDTKYERACSWLKKIALNYQILYFSCRKRV